MRIDEFMNHLKAIPKIYRCEKCPFNARNSYDPERDKHIVCSLKGRLCLVSIMDNLDNAENLSQIEGVLQLEEYLQENERKNNKLKNSEV